MERLCLTLVCKEVIVHTACVEGRQVSGRRKEDDCNYAGQALVREYVDNMYIWLTVSKLKCP